MKLIIQIPCFNEEKTLPITFKDLPKKIDGISTIEYLIIDDGSTDKTVEVAKKLGIHHIIKLPNHRGLAKGFARGINDCIELGADIIVNTDGDNQYHGEDIKKLVKPIIDRKADIVIGDRQINSSKHMSIIKKILQKIGSHMVRLVSNTTVIDTTSGFRAYSRDAAIRLNITSDYSYTLETIIDAGHKKLAIVNVPITTNSKLRESRLFKSNWIYIKKSVATIIRIYSTIKPLQICFIIGNLIILFGVVLGFNSVNLTDSGFIINRMGVFIFSLFFITVGIQVLITGFLADAISLNRKITDEILYQVKKNNYKK